MTYVFSVSDLRHPITTLEGSFDHMGFDQAAGKIYTFAYKGQSTERGALDELKPDGSIEASYPLAYDRGYQLLVHPAGRRLALSHREKPVLDHLA